MNVLVRYKVGDKVKVEGVGEGFVRFLGDHAVSAIRKVAPSVTYAFLQTKTGIRVGVELLEPVGKNSGTVDGN